MNIQTTFIYCFLTIILMYGLIWLDFNYFNTDNNNHAERHERVLRLSILSGLIVWFVIVFFIYRAENEIPELLSNNQIIIEGKF